MCTKPKKETLDKQYPDGGTRSLNQGTRLKNGIPMSWLLQVEISTSYISCSTKNRLHDHNKQFVVAYTKKWYFPQ